MIFKVIIIVFGLLLLGIYAIPLTTVTLNIGNLFGCGYASLLIICGILFDKSIFKIVLILMLIFLIPFMITIGIIVKETVQKNQKNNTVIILGCRVKGDKPSLALIERCKAGARYLSKNENAIAILSGGQGKDELISEADCMKALLINYGIDEGRLFVESKSTSTFENLAFSKRIIEKNNLDKRIAIVSSDYHLFRAKMIAKSINFDSIETIKSKSKWYCVPTFYTREVFGIWAKIAKIKE